MSTRAPRELSLRLPGGPGAVAAARHALDDFAGDMDGSLVSDARLLVSELVTNSVRHGEAARSGEVGFHVAVAAEVMRIEVSDAGAGFEPVARTVGQDEGSGWGLFLVEQLADRWGVERNGPTRVWFELGPGRALPGRSAGAAAA